MEHEADSFSKHCASPQDARREASHLKTLCGPGIVALRGQGGSGELVLAKAACSLADVLAERGPLAEGEVRAVGAAAAAALARVHDAGLVHGDVKPANLLLSPDGELWLGDFDATCDADGEPLGRFSPPRSLPGAPARPATDISALALALVELTTGSLLDPDTSWRTIDLRRLGCSARLSAELSFMLGGEGSSPSARGAADMFERNGTGSLPAPAARTRRVDPTPTVEFMPVHSRPRPGSAGAEPAASEPPPRWWRRLTTSWQPR